MQLIVPVEDCNARWKPTAQKRSFRCNFEACNEELNKRTLIIPKNKNVGGKHIKHTNKTDGYFRSK